MLSLDLSWNFGILWFLRRRWQCFKQLSLAKTWVYENIIVEGDAFQIMNTMRSKGRNYRSFRQLLEDTCMVLASLSSWQIVHIKGDANFVVHDLTNASIKQVIDDVWIEKIPSCICDIVLLKQSARFPWLINEIHIFPQKKKVYFVSIFLFFLSF